MIFSFFAFMYLGRDMITNVTQNNSYVHLVKNVVTFCGFHSFVSFCDYHIINSNYPQKKTGDSNQVVS